jgi:hypothetical protein
MDPYQILNIPPGSPPEVIEQAFRVAAARVHPNNGGTREQFAQVVAAYNALSQTNPTAGPAPAPPPAPRQPQHTQPAPQSQRYVVAPRIHATPSTNRTSTIALRVAAGLIVGSLAFFAGFLFTGGTTPLAIAGAIGASAAAASIGPALLIAAYVPPTRYLLIAATIGIATWPTIFGAVVAIAAVTGILFILKNLRLL